MGRNRPTAGDIRSRREQGRRPAAAAAAGRRRAREHALPEGIQATSDVNDLLDEGQAAHDAGAHHHANWAVKAADVVLARLKLARVTFEEGGGGWVEVLAESRPEYEPRGAFSVDAS